MLYRQYVDDIFCIFRKDVSFESFHKKLNKLHKSINITYKLGGNELPFLDIIIKLTTEKIITRVYRKKIDTDVILNFSAITPIKWKRALILWFMNRAKIIASTDTIYKQQITNLKEKFIKNCYPKKFVDDVIEISINYSKECINEILNSSNFKNILKVPYIGKPSIVYKKKMKNF